jgi:hypothetical protein
MIFDSSPSQPSFAIAVAKKRGKGRRRNKPPAEAVPDRIAFVDFGEETGLGLIDRDGTYLFSATIECVPGCEGALTFGHALSGLIERGREGDRSLLVGFELVGDHLSAAAAHAWGQWRGITLYVCGLARVPTRGVPWQSIKAVAGVSGAVKPLTQARARWPALVDARGEAFTHHEADALFGAEWLRLWRDPRDSTT